MKHKKPSPLKKATKLLKGQKKPNTSSLKGREAGTSTRNAKGKQVGSKAKRAKKKSKA